VGAEQVIFLVIPAHASRRDASDRPGFYAAAGLGRNPSISRKVSPNNFLGTATSAI